jgi:L-lysine exporter family protein LysE/ArgO
VHQGLIAAIAGFGTGLSLIVAIGAQNAFVLRQGIRRSNVAAVVAICTVSDVVLIGLGVAGVGALVSAWPAAITVVTVVGGVFLICYGLLAARRALRPGHLDPSIGTGASLLGTVLTCLALTWLNPHVYLDTVLLLGSVANGYGGQRWLFGVGAAVASLLWFGGLGFGARLLGGLFARPAAWRVLDAVIAATMITIGVLLLCRA